MSLKCFNVLLQDNTFTTSTGLQYFYIVVSMLISFSASCATFIFCTVKTTKKQKVYLDKCRRRSCRITLLSQGMKDLVKRNSAVDDH